jgi:signal transduction histidine kinase
MDVHHVVEALGILMCGVIFYSYAYRWLPLAPRLATGRSVVLGAAFGVITVALMIARIQVQPGVAMDVRHSPVALIGLFEGPAAGLTAAVAGALYRAWMGGPGAIAGIWALLLVGLAGGLVRRHALARGGVSLAHSLALAAITYAITAASFFSLGARGVRLFGEQWWELAAADLIGIGLAARLFVDVVERDRREAAEREAAALRSVTMLANAAAHEINNPLTAVVGHLDLMSQRLPEGSREAEWVKRCKDASLRISEIVARMRHITRLEPMESPGHLPPTLDIEKSSKEKSPEDRS